MSDFPRSPLTERKPAEAALAASEARFRALFDYFPDGVLVVHAADRRILSANPAMCRMLGYTEAEMLKLGVVDIHPSESLARVAVEFERLSQGKTHFAPSTPVRRKNGSVFLADISASRVDVVGTPCMLGLFRDITERTQAEQTRQEHRELQDQLAKVAASVPGLIYSFKLRPDGTTCVPFATPALEEIFGVQPESAREDFAPVLARVHPDDREALRQGIAESARTLQAWRGLFRIQHPQRGELWVEGHSVPRREPDGSILWHGFAQDVTAQKRSETEARRQEARLHLALEAAEMVAWELDVASGRLSYSSNLAAVAGADDISPYTSLESFVEQVHPQDRDKTRRAIARTMESGALFDCEYRVALPDGSWHWLAGRGRAVAGADGRTAYVVGVSQDITGRKAMVESLRQSELRFRGLFENSPDGILVLDPASSQFLAANPAAVALFGMPTAAELVSRPPWAFSPECQPDGRDSGEKAREMIAAAVRQGFHSFEWRHRRLDGQDFLATVQLVRVDLGEQTLLQATVRDITERRRLEDEREAALIKYRTLFDSLPLGITVTDGLGHLVESNRVADAILGITAEERARRHIDGAEWQIIRPDGTPMPPGEFASVRALREQRLVRDVEMGLVKSPSETVWITVTAAPVPLPGLGVVITYSDISARRRSEQALRESQELGKAIFDSVDASIAVLDRHGLITAVNLPWQRSLLEDASGPELHQKCGPGANYLEICRDASGKSAEGARAAMEGIQQVLDGRLPRFELDYVCESSEGRRWGFMIVTPLGSDRRGAVVSHSDITARKQAEDDLRSSEFKHRIVADNTFDWEFWLTPEGRFSYTSPSCERITGYRAAEFAADPELMRRILHPDDRARFDAHQCVALRGDSEPEQEFRIVRADGEVRWIGHVCAPIRDAAGGFLGVRGSNRDITERKQAEEGLQASEHLLRRMGRVAKVGGWEFEVATGAGRWTEEVARIHDVEPGAETNKSFALTFFPPESRDRIEAAIERAINQALPYELDLELVSAKGVRKWVRTIGEPVLENGRVVRVHGALQEITDQKRAENELIRVTKEQETLLRFNQALLDAVPTPVFYKDRNGRYLGCNRSFTQLIGLTAEAIQGKTVHDLWPGEMAHQYHAKDLELLAHPVEQSYEFAIQDKNGVDHSVIFVKNVFRDEDNQPAGIIGAFLDISARKRAEEALRQEQQRLASIILGANVGTWEWNVQTGETVFNERWAEMIGYTLAELAPISIQTWARLAHPDDLTESNAILERHFRGELDYYDCEARLRHKDGHWIWVLDRGRVTSWTEDRKPLLMQGTHVDVTERKMAQEALAAEATRRRLLIESSRDGIVVLDREGKVFEANRRFAEMLGYTSEELQRLHVWDWDRDWPRERVVEAIRALGPEGAHFESRHWRKDGSFFEVELSNSAAELGGQKLVFCVCHDITEQKRAREALAAREEIFSSTVNQAADAIAVFDLDSNRFVEFNAAAYEGLGYSREEFATFGVRDIQAEHSPEVIRQNIDKVRREGGASFETRHRHRDGSVRQVRVSIRQLGIRNRNYMSSVWTDITEQKHAEARAARDRLRTEFLLELHQRAPQLGDKDLYDHVLDRAVRLTGSAIGFFHQVSEDQQTIILTTWNQAALEDCKAAFNTHYPVKEAGNWVDCIREQRPVVYNDYVHSPHQRGLPEGHTPVRRFMSIPVIQDGRTRIIFGVGNKAEDYTEEDVGQLQVVANELHKIMIQRTAQDQLRQLSRAVEQSPVSVIITDTSGAIEYVNPTFSRISGYDLAEVRGQNPRLLKSGEMPPAHYQQLWQTILAGQPWHGEFHNRKKSGELHWESTSISPITDPTGRITHFVAVKEDITERKLLESQLRQAQKLEAVGHLAGGVAHDFNNILAAIMMHLGLLQTNPDLDETTLQSLRELEEEAQRAAGLTRQLLMFSRRSVLAIRPQAMNEIVANLLKMLTRLIGENIKLRFEGSSHLPSVEADAGMLEQVLLNLVVNARDAMPKGGRITIETSCVDVATEGGAIHPDRRRGRFVCLAVRDTGVGMDEATLKRIFEPFFTTKEAGKGTGLGLATVHGIVAQHKGWVEVESVAGQGSIFRVFLPAVAQAAASAASAAETAPPRRGKETILVVEDETRLRQLVGRTLRVLGYRVFEAENGQEAMRIWQACGGQVDLLLTDMVMPEGMTGLELAERLQGVKPGLKVIISSGYSAEIVDAGVPTKKGITYLPKPYGDRPLAEIVRNCLDQEG